jgi:hypothetical protein
MKRILTELAFALALAIFTLFIGTPMPVVAIVFGLALFFRFTPDRAAAYNNSFGTLNTTLIAQKTLTTLLAKFPHSLEDQRRTLAMPRFSSANRSRSSSPLPAPPSLIPPRTATSQPMAPSPMPPSP